MCVFQALLDFQELQKGRQNKSLPFYYYYCYYYHHYHPPSSSSMAVMDLQTPGEEDSSLSLPAPQVAFRKIQRGFVFGVRLVFQCFSECFKDVRSRQQTAPQLRCSQDKVVRARYLEGRASSAIYHPLHPLAAVVASLWPSSSLLSLSSLTLWIHLFTPD